MRTDSRIQTDSESASWQFGFRMACMAIDGGFQPEREVEESDSLVAAGYAHRVAQYDRSAASPMHEHKWRYHDGRDYFYCTECLAVESAQ